MSTFDGVIQECPSIRADLFKDLDGVHSYFLSHAHSDHMVGLDSGSFYSHVVETKAKLYCSPVTKILLESLPQYQRISKCFTTLPVDEPYEIVLPVHHVNNDWLTVTLVPAGHCPGSVMFFFEGSNWKALYTGDFRLDIGSACKVPWFHNGEAVKDINTVYIDSTFMTPDTSYLCSRPESNKEILSQVKKHLDKGPNHVIFIKTGARFGYENVYKQVYQAFGYKVHVAPNKYKCYSCIPEILDTVTQESDTRIFSGFSLKQMGLNKYLKVKVIKLSTLFFVLNRLPSVVYKDNRQKTTRICYSFHSSMEEVLDFLLYLSPRQVKPNVKPIGLTLDETGEMMTTLLEQAKKTSTASLEPSIPHEWKPFGKIKNRTKGNSQVSSTKLEQSVECNDADRTLIESDSEYSDISCSTGSSDQMLLYKSDSDSSTCPELSCLPLSSPSKSNQMLAPEKKEVLQDPICLVTPPPNSDHNEPCSIADGSICQKENSANAGQPCFSVSSQESCYTIVSSQVSCITISSESSCDQMLLFDKSIDEDEKSNASDTSVDQRLLFSDDEL